MIHSFPSGEKGRRWCVLRRLIPLATRDFEENVVYVVPCVQEEVVNERKSRVNHDCSVEP